MKTVLLWFLMVLPLLAEDHLEISSFNADSIGLAKGTPVSIFPRNGGYIRASSLAISNTVFGLLPVDADTGQSSQVLIYGSLNLSDWTGIIGSSTLQPSAYYYVSSVPGKLTTTSSGISQIAGRAISTTLFLVSPQFMNTNTSAFLSSMSNSLYLQIVSSTNSWQTNGFWWLFGDGSDGAVVFDGSSTVLGLPPITNSYTLQRSLYCTSITVNPGVTVFAGGMRIFCTSALTNNGTISRDGTRGSDGTSGGGVSTSFGGLGANGVSRGDAGGSGSGGDGGNGTASAGQPGGNGNSVSATYNEGGLGGQGGSGGTGINAGGTSPAEPSYTPRYVKFISPYAIGASITDISDQLLGGVGGTGGGAGGGKTGRNGGAGGGGGSGGGFVMIFASTIYNANGTISAKGGGGGNGGSTVVVDTSGGGGGGAGGGGVIYLVYNSLTSGTITVAGGTHGNKGTGGGGAGTDGVDGSDGATGLLLSYQLSSGVGGGPPGPIGPQGLTGPAGPITNVAASGSQGIIVGGSPITNSGTITIGASGNIVTNGMTLATTVSNDFHVDATHVLYGDGQAAFGGITNSGGTASRLALYDSHTPPKLLSAAASGAVSVNADGSATTAAQINTLFPGFIVTNNNANVLVLSNTVKLDAGHALSLSNATASHVLQVGADSTVSSVASGAVPIDGDGTATTFAQVNTLAPGYVVTNGNSSVLTLSNTTTVDPSHIFYAADTTNTVVWAVANYVVLPTDKFVLITGNHTTTMPAAGANGVVGKWFWIQCTSAGTNAILRAGSETFSGNFGQGLTKLTNTAVGKAIMLFSNGTNWWYNEF